MDEDRELSGRMVLKLFPLPGVVMFPHSVLPLHIFEPRYRQMTEDALESDRLITIVSVRPGVERVPGVPPTLEEYGCVGRIFNYERLPDGRYNFLLVGLKRVRLLGEPPSGKLYRVADVDVIEDDEVDPESVGRLRDALVDRFRRLVTKIGGIVPEIETLISSDIRLGVLVDIIAHASALGPEQKQSLLAEERVGPRLEHLVAYLDVLLAEKEGPDSEVGQAFPPHFSPN